MISIHNNTHMIQNAVNYTQNSLIAQSLKVYHITCDYYGVTAEYTVTRYMSRPDLLMIVAFLIQLYSTPDLADYHKILCMSYVAHLPRDDHKFSDHLSE